MTLPQRVAELLHAMRGFFGFAVSFALLFRLWGYQYRFFRRYALEDPTTIRLNGVPRMQSASVRGDVGHSLAPTV
jgi:hypothetical protein